MRLAGTCSRYSNSAMPQLASAATIQGRPDRFFRCAYQAKVMNTLDRTSSAVAARAGGMVMGMRGYRNAGLVESRCRRLPQTLQPLLCHTQDGGPEPARAGAPPLARRHDTGALQSTQMLQQ